ncbi:hypothetical protein HMPREF0183_1128 [Brevibacterium mcbrellneri ATCC 49030]|uniref:Uncharacterized protein n=1 Tax=Brevibacterium mcbrellneri ATCC 49030 TaxID=585530 RepID=D4YMG8_9MICO|nr:hypothetical protein [Brevibacterium mcbrellneri]EFG47629.1 hypothetical protein HMPREF0183_1128 [Brevibacterium mcbrellneri ATCC 49030]
MPRVSASHLLKICHAALELTTPVIRFVFGGDIEHESKLLHRIVRATPLPNMQNSAEFSHIDTVLNDFGRFIGVRVGYRVIWR